MKSVASSVMPVFVNKLLMNSLGIIIKTDLVSSLTPSYSFSCMDVVVV